MFQTLTWLDLSYNRLVRLDDGVFSDLQYLTHLDLSHNKQLLLETRGRTFHGLEDSLLYLDLSNISLLSVRILVTYLLSDFEYVLLKLIRL